MADEIKGVEVPPDLLGKFIEKDPAAGKFFDDGLLAVGVFPDVQECVQGRVRLPDRLARVVLEGFGDELAVGVEVLNALADDRHFHIIDVVLGLAARGQQAGSRPSGKSASAPIDRPVFLHFWRFIRRHWRFVGLGFVNLNRVAIKARVGKERGGPLEIHDGEEELVVVLVDAGTAADDLLEFGHGVDAFVEHDQAAGLRIDARRHQLRGRGNDREGGFRIDEVVELRLAFVVVAGDAHDVLAVGGSQVRVGIDQRLTHALGVVDVLAEDDGLGEAVGGLEKLGDLGGDEFGALFEDQVPVEVRVVVLAVLDELAVLVRFAFFRAPTFQVFVDADADHFVRGQETIGDALPERVGVDRIAEVLDIGYVLGFLGRCGEANLRGRREVFEDFAPGRIVGRTATVTLVHDDQVEEVRGELFIDVLLLLRSRDGLIERQVDFECLIDRAIGDLGHRLTERLEVVGLGLVGEDVAVDEEEDALLGARLPKPPDDLEGGVCLACAGGHHKQDAVLAAGDGLDGAVDGDELVVTRRLAGTVFVVVLRSHQLPGLR